jgi:hypothetical protein
LIGIVVGLEPRCAASQAVHDLHGDARLNFQECRAQGLRRPLMGLAVGQCENGPFSSTLMIQFHLESGEVPGISRRGWRLGGIVLH